MSDYKNPLSRHHVNSETFSQRLTTRQWRTVLLHEDDKFIMNGHLRQLKAKNLGAGVVEVSKVPLKLD